MIKKLKGNYPIDRVSGAIMSDTSFFAFHSYNVLIRHQILLNYIGNRNKWTRRINGRVTRVKMGSKGIHI